MGSSVAEKLIRKAEIKTIITAEKMMDKFPDFPWTNDVFEISAWLKNLVKKPYQLLKEALILKLPISLSRFFLKIPTDQLPRRQLFYLQVEVRGIPRESY